MIPRNRNNKIMTANVDFSIRLMKIIMRMDFDANRTKIKSKKYRSAAFSFNAISCRWDWESLSNRDQRQQGNVFNAIYAVECGFLFVWTKWEEKNHILALHCMYVCLWSIICTSKPILFEGANLCTYPWTKANHLQLASSE